MSAPVTPRLTAWSVKIACFLVLVALPFGSTVSAQSTFSTITGHATDESGAAVPEVEVVATHHATGITVTTRTNERGIYTLGNLREGGYGLRAIREGFKELVVSDVLLVSGEVRRVDLSLEVSAIEETVELSPTVGLIQTDSQTLSDTRSFFELTSLPLNSKGSFSYYALVPTYQTIKGTTAPSFGGSGLGQFGLSIDGVPTLAGTNNTMTNLLTSQEGFEETKYDYVNNSAEFGELAHISIITTPGVFPGAVSFRDVEHNKWFY